MLHAILYTMQRLAKKDEDETYGRYLEDRRDEEGYGPIETLHQVSNQRIRFDALNANYCCGG